MKIVTTGLVYAEASPFTTKYNFEDERMEYHLFLKGQPLVLTTPDFTFTIEGTELWKDPHDLFWPGQVTVHKIEFTYTIQTTLS